MVRCYSGNKGISGNNAYDTCFILTWTRNVQRRLSINWHICKVHWIAYKRNCNIFTNNYCITKPVKLKNKANKQI